MRIGYIGLGKLGLPVALAVESKGHEVLGFDIDPRIRNAVRELRWPFAHEEQEVAGLLKNSAIHVVDSLDGLVDCDIVFVAVQTPHDAAYGGEVPAPDEWKDFDYSHLIDAMSAWRLALGRSNDYAPLTVVVSTVLPGTMRREVLPWWPEDFPIVYSPAFIAMGTVVPDYLNPEMVLCGVTEVPLLMTPGTPAWELHHFSESLGHTAPILPMTIESAELTKVAYNTFITTKIVFANAIMELSNGVDADADVVMHALTCATDRIVSGKYMMPGMGDGGACHPRDNIALAWLGERLGLSFNIFATMVRAREQQSMWLARYVADVWALHQLPVVLLGAAYKPGVALTAGSPSLLLSYHLSEIGIEHEIWDPVLGWGQPPAEPSIIVMTCNHEDFVARDYPDGSFIVDPISCTDRPNTYYPGRLS